MLPGNTASRTLSKDVWAYLALTYGFAWVMWIAAIKAHLGEEWLNIGTAGPALAAMFLASRRGAIGGRGEKTRWAWFIAWLVVCWMVLSLHYSWRGENKLAFHMRPLLILPALLPAWVLSGAASRNTGVRDLMRRLVHRPNRWSLIAFFSFPAFMLIPAGIVRLFGGPLVWPQQSGTLPVVVAKALMFLGYNILFAAALEEPGWRGFLLDRLESRFSPLLSTMLVWLPWMLWHGPLDHYRPVPFGLMNWLLVRVVFLIPLCIILTWFYNRSGRSIQSTVLFHASMNTFPFVLPYSMPAFGLLFVWAGYAVFNGRMGRRPS
jgi:membrane protease YdiL (CAAX protease family)